MSKTVNKQKLVERIANRMSRPINDVEPVLEAVIEEIYEALKHEETVNLRDFGTFYIDVRRSGTVFKFNPSQRLRALFGWSSTYQGDL